MPNNETTIENILECETNKGNYKLSIIAQFNNYDSVKYIIRIQKPNGEPSDFVSTIEGFKKFGELLTNLNLFAKEKLYTKDMNQMKELLTSENIKTYVKFKKAGQFTT